MISLPTPINFHLERNKASQAYGNIVMFHCHLQPSDVLQMTDAAALVVDVVAEADADYIQIHIYSVTGVTSWIRIPERRSMSRRIETAKALQETAKMISVPAFVQYIQDCGFKQV